MVKVVKKFKNKAILFTVVGLILLAGMVIVNHLNKKNNTQQKIEFDVEEVMRINNQKIVMNEFLLYAADVYQGYNLQNQADWNSEVLDSANNRITYEEHVKATICEQIRMTKILCMKAKEDGISLSSDEKAILVNNAQTYYTNLISANVTDETLTVDLISIFFEENALAQKVYNSIIEGYDDYQNSSTAKDYDSENDDLTEKELYFIDVYKNLSLKYDENYNLYTSINWDLLELISFAEMSNGNGTSLKEK